MDISELEFIQIILILLLVAFMMVMIICLFNHYWLPALAFFSRLSNAQRDQATQTVMCGHINSNLPPFMQQQQQLCRFQPTYPYLQQEVINLPLLVCLPDGEELIPYKGPFGLQLRHPDQQLELNRATVRAPPNRTVLDTNLLDIYMHSGSLQPPSSNYRTIKANARLEDPPPSYSEVMRDHPDSTACQLSNNVPPTENKSECARSQTVFHATCSGPESTAKASTDEDR